MFYFVTFNSKPGAEVKPSSYERVVNSGVYTWQSYRVCNISAWIKILGQLQKCISKVEQVKRVVWIYWRCHLASQFVVHRNVRCSTWHANEERYFLFRSFHLLQAPRAINIVSQYSQVLAEESRDPVAVIPASYPDGPRGAKWLYWRGFVLSSCEDSSSEHTATFCTVLPSSWFVNDGTIRQYVLLVVESTPDTLRMAGTLVPGCSVSCVPVVSNQPSLARQIHLPVHFNF